MSFVSEQGLLAVSSNSECGTIFDTSNSTLPTGTLYCNGETKNTADYPELAAALGESGATFDLPFLVNEKTYDENDITVTLDPSDGTMSSYRIDAVPRVVDGEWWLTFQFIGVVSSAARTLIAFNMDGVVFDDYQECCASAGATDLIARAYVNPSGDGDTFAIEHSSITATSYKVFGDVKLASKPSWVLDNSPANYDVYKVIRYAPKTALQGTYEERPKNYIGNGDMTVCQSHSATATGTDATSGDDIVDRFRIDYSGAMDFYKWQDTSTVPYALVADVQTADSSIAAGDYALITNVVEGYDFQALKDETVTVTFDVYGKAGTYCFSLRNATPDLSYVIEYTIDSDSTWQTITKNITIDTSSGTWNYTNGAGLYLTWAIACGSTFHTASTDQWVSGNYMATSNQTNGCAGTGTDYDFKLRNVALYKGSYTAATVPEFRPKNDSYQANLAECQRYWITFGKSGKNYERFGVGKVHSSKITYIPMRLPVQMRVATPILTYSAYSDFSIVTSAGNETPTAIILGVGSHDTPTIGVTTAAPTVHALGEFTASNVTTARLHFDARL